jgi:hypothetical protein
MLLALVLGSACGPVTASTAVGKAEAAIKAAEKSVSHDLAPYSYWLAVSYLEKAKLTEGYSEFAASEDFAKQAQSYALDCVDEAEQERARQKLLDANTRGRPMPQKKKRRKKRRPTGAK